MLGRGEGDMGGRSRVITRAFLILILSGDGGRGSGESSDRRKMLYKYTVGRDVAGGGSGGGGGGSGGGGCGRSV